ncbi:MAG: radical SAM protein [Oscillospiraceae bacterium]|nr:radical SAM protein [Oscillospiraceae bacterium]
MAKDTSADIRRVLTRRCARLGVPVSGSFELTPRCNLRCKMCYVRLTPEQMAPIGRELTAAEWLDLAQSARDAGMLFLLITGGEPTLRTDFPEIYEGLAQMGLSISINTNGTLLTPAIRELWHRLPPASVNVTLYGTSRDDYEALCVDANAFDRIVDGLNWLKSEGILVHLNTTIVPTNVHKWQQIEEFAKKMDVDLRLISYCFPPARREECGGCVSFERLSPETAGMLTVQDLLFREGIDAVRRRAASLSEPPSADCQLDIGEPMRCMAGRSQFWVTWDGRMTPCGMLSAPKVRPLAQGFPAAWEALRKETEKIRLCPDCVDCPERATCMNCAAVTVTETGRFEGKPEYMCKLNRAYRETLKKLAQENNQ